MWKEAEFQKDPRRQKGKVTLSKLCLLSWLPFPERAHKMPELRAQWELGSMKTLSSWGRRERLTNTPPIRDVSSASRQVTLITFSTVYHQTLTHHLEC